MDSRREDVTLKRVPSLDGLRGVALLGVLGFHGGVSWLAGGYLGLTTFFVLSGFLIASLLLAERRRTGTIRLRAFWARRARRLVPGALLGIAAAAGFVAFFADTRPASFEGDALASLTWLTNWRFVAEGVSYDDFLSAPSPLRHYWSLAVEEQFYLVLPLLAALLLRGRLRTFTTAIAGLAVASVVTMAVLHDAGEAPLRVYYGTDARAAELLIGVLLACALVGPTGWRQLPGRWRTVADGGAIAATGISAWLWCTVDGFDDWLFEGGLAGVAALSAIVIVAAVQPGSLVGRVFAARPLVGLGLVSYGAYVLHWPVFLWLSPQRTGLDGAPLFATRLGIVLVLATASYLLLEQPVRTGRAAPRLVALGWVNGAVAVAGAVVVAAASLPQPAITLRAAGAAPPPPPVVVLDDRPASSGATTTTTDAADATAASTTTAPTTGAPVTTPATTAPTTRTVRRSPAAGEAEAAPAPSPATSPATTAPPTTAAPGPAPPPPPVRVLVLGDSLAINLSTGLERWSQHTNQLVVWDHGAGGCPIGLGGERRSELEDYPIDKACTWWTTDQARREIAAFQPDVVLVAAGLLDLFDRKLPEWHDYRRPGDPVFDSWLLSEYQAAAEVLGATGATLLWAPPPCTDWYRFWRGHVDPEGYDRRRIHLRETTVRAAVASGVWAHADLDRQLCPGGQFTDDALGIDGSRPDGLHITDEASEVLARRWLGPLLVDAGRRSA